MIKLTNERSLLPSEAVRQLDIDTFDTDILRLKKVMAVQWLMNEENVELSELIPLLCNDESALFASEIKIFKFLSSFELTQEIVLFLLHLNGEEKVRAIKFCIENDLINQINIDECCETGLRFPFLYRSPSDFIFQLIKEDFKLLPFLGSHATYLFVIGCCDCPDLAKKISEEWLNIINQSLSKKIMLLNRFSFSTKNKEGEEIEFSLRKCLDFLEELAQDELPISEHIATIQSIPPLVIGILLKFYPRKKETFFILTPFFTQEQLRFMAKALPFSLSDDHLSDSEEKSIDTLLNRFTNDQLEDFIAYLPIKLQDTYFKQKKKLLKMRNSSLQKELEAFELELQDPPLLNRETYDRLFAQYVNFKDAIHLCTSKIINCMGNIALKKQKSAIHLSEKIFLPFQTNLDLLQKSISYDKFRSNQKKYAIQLDNIVEQVELQEDENIFESWLLAMIKPAHYPALGIEEGEAGMLQNLDELHLVGICSKQDLDYLGINLENYRAYLDRTNQVKELLSSLAPRKDGEKWQDVWDEIMNIAYNHNDSVEKLVEHFDDVVADQEKLPSLFFLLMDVNVPLDAEWKRTLKYGLEVRKSTNPLVRLQAYLMQPQLKGEDAISLLQMWNNGKRVKGNEEQKIKSISDLFDRNWITDRRNLFYLLKNKEEIFGSRGF